MALSVLRGTMSIKEAVERCGVCASTVREWASRFRSEGPAARMDRSSRPLRCPLQISVSVTAEIAILPRQRLTSLPGCTTTIGIDLTAV